MIDSYVHIYDYKTGNTVTGYFMNLCYVLECKWKNNVSKSVCNFCPHICLLILILDLSQYMATCFDSHLGHPQANVLHKINYNCTLNIMLID